MNVFELYSGIGGMHFAFKASNVVGEVKQAIDINPTANAVYRLNFPDHILLEKNIQSLTESLFSDLDINMIMMSPPCQPYTRNGLKKDKEDPRSSSLFHILQLIPRLKTLKFILLENVQGFETSDVRDEVLRTLNESEFIYQEFLLNPVQFGIPNSRLRYYLLAKKKPERFCFQVKDAIMEELPQLCDNVENELKEIVWEYKKTASSFCFIENVLDNGNVTLVPDKILQKYGKILDVVTSNSTRSCCFTKAYTHYIEGTGSVFCPEDPELVAQIYEQLKDVPKEKEEYLTLLKKLNLRFFTPREVARLMCFPSDFLFPDSLTNKQKYRVLGNSINVHVVALLTRILVS